LFFDLFIDLLSLVYYNDVYTYILMEQACLNKKTLKK